MQPSDQDQSSQPASTGTTEAANTAKQKTGVGKIISGIEKPFVSAAIFIGKEAGVIAKAFASEEPVIQRDLKNASNLVQVIKTEVNEDPVVVSYLLRKIDPSYTDDTLNNLLTKAASALNITTEVIQPTLVDTIKSLQAHANQLPDQIAHNNFWTGLFNTIGILVSPGTPWGKIVTFGVYIYNTYFKPKTV